VIVCVCVCVCVRARRRARVRACVRVCMREFVRLCVRACESACVGACARLCVFVRACVAHLVSGRGLEAPVYVPTPPLHTRMVHENKLPIILLPFNPVFYTFNLMLKWFVFFLVYFVTLSHD